MAQTQFYEDQDLKDTLLKDLKLRCSVFNSQNRKFSDLQTSYDNFSMKIGEILTQIESEIDHTSESLSRQIKVASLENQDLGLPKDRVYTLKAVPVTWEDCSHAYLHVISDITSLKELEKEKATNK